MHKSPKPQLHRVRARKAIGGKEMERSRAEMVQIPAAVKESRKGMVVKTGAVGKTVMGGMIPTQEDGRIASGDGK